MMRTIGSPVCSDEESFTVTIISSPTASITNNNGPLCEGDNASFTISGTPNATITYNINSGASTTITLDGTTGEATITLTTVTADQTLNLESVSIGTAPNDCF